MPRTTIRNRLNLQVAMILTGIFLLGSFVYGVFFYRNMDELFWDFYSSKGSITSYLAKASFNWQEVQRYIDQLKADATLPERQMAFHATRERLLSLHKDPNANPEELALLRTELREFHVYCARFKDARYYEILASLKSIRDEARAKYIYVYADTGLPGLYTFIFDTSDNGPESGLDADGMGTVNSRGMLTPESALVLDSGQTVRSSTYYDNHYYGQAYYFYSPVLNGAGQPIALLGTDIAPDVISGAIRQLLWGNVALFTFIGLAVLLGVFMFFRLVIITPLGSLTQTAASLAEGRLDSRVDQSIYRKNNELSRLGKALDEAGTGYRELLQGTANTCEEAWRGNFAARNAHDSLKGDFATLAGLVNATLDAVTGYLDNMQSALLIAGPDMRNIFTNRRFAETFGKRTAEELFALMLQTQSACQVQLPSSEEMRCQMAQKLASGGCSCTLGMEYPDGTWGYFAVNAAKMTIEEQKNENILILATDITSLMLEKEKAQAALNAKRNFLSRVTLGLHTPLQAITRISGHAISGRGKAQDCFKGIEEASASLLTAINDLLNLHRAEHGNPIEDFWLDVCPILQNSLNFFTLEAEKNGVTLSAHCAEGIPRVKAEQGRRLRQVLDVMLTRAVRGARQGGLIALNADLPAKSGILRISIIDNSVGIGEKFFYKASGENEDAPTGYKPALANLGLEMCKNLVEAMGGAIQPTPSPLSTLSPDGADKNRDFVFTLPLAAEEFEHVPELLEVAGNIDMAGMSVLLVDDIEMNRLILLEMLADYGLNIHEAADGAEALEIFCSKPEYYFDLIFMDIQMPRLNGYDATAAIRSLARADATVPIIAMTANVLPEDVENAMRYGMNGHIAKPVDINLCLQYLRHYKSSR